MTYVIIIIHSTAQFQSLFNKVLDTVYFIVLYFETGDLKKKIEINILF